MVTELDPDAPTRQRKQLQSDDAKDEERLMARVFRLLRAGEQQHRGSDGLLSGSPASARPLSSGDACMPACLPAGNAAVYSLCTDQHRVPVAPRPPALPCPTPRCLATCARRTSCAS